METRSRAIERGIIKLCGAQNGSISRPQLLRIGLGDSGVEKRIQRGRLHRVYHGAYSLTREVDREAVWQAGVLAAGAGSVLSHMSAAHAWAISAVSGPTEVSRTTSVGRVGRGEWGGESADRGQAVLPGYANLPVLSIHQTRSLHRLETTIRKGIPITTVARTFVDIAATLGEGQLKSLLHEAARNHQLKFDEVRAVIARARGKKGIKRLRAIIDDWDPQTARTRNDFEHLMLDLCRGGELPIPVVNATVAGYEVDFFFPDHGLIVETDGARDHDTPFGRERDRERDSDLQLRGFLILRLTPPMLTRQPDESMRKVREHLTLCEREGRRTDPGWASASTGNF